MGVTLPLACCFVFFFTVVAGCPKHHYYYQVLEIPEPALDRIGERIVEQLKAVRGNTKRESCYDANQEYLIPSGLPSSYDWKKMAAAFLYEVEHRPQFVFHGVMETERALGLDCTYNILMAKTMAVRRFLLINTTDGEIFEQFLTEDEVLNKIATVPEWKDVDVLECKHYLHHFSKEYARHNITLTIVDRYAAEAAELDISHISDIGGFWKKECVGREE